MKRPHFLDRYRGERRVRIGMYLIPSPSVSDYFVFKGMYR
jgi:hypothetical protein